MNLDLEEEWQEAADFIKATGGGKGNYEKKRKGQRTDDRIFHQKDHCSSEKCGFGRLKFNATDEDFKLYLRIPSIPDHFVPKMVVYFIRTVWNLPCPKLLIGITGGARDFKISPEVEMLLTEIMQITRETDAWIVTGGEARFRFGGNIPLIGITTWGCVANREKLEVKPSSYNYGYITREPVFYDDVQEDKLKDLALLEQNHSHFLLVDDGSSNKFGKEIPFRGEFEKCVCTNDEQSYGHLMFEHNFGWEGGTYSPQHGRKPPPEGGVHRLCLCFEGGVGTIGTVEASVQNGTPTLVVQDTGRAADLIADFLQVYSGEESARVRPRSSAKLGEKQEHDRRKEQTAKLASLMLQDEKHRKSLGGSRPNREKIIDQGRVLLEQYKIESNTEPEKLLMLMDNLHTIATSGLCLAYRPGSVRKVGDEWVPISIRESMSQCLLLGITKAVAPTIFADQLARARASPVLAHSTVPAQVSGPFPRVQAAVFPQPASMALRNARGTGDAGEAEGRAKADAEQKLCFAKLQLLTEWGQVGMLGALLHERQGTDDMVSSDELGRLLQLALLQNQPDIATLAFVRGADVGAYEDPTCYGGEAGGEDQVWVELLEGASDEQEERYMLTLIQAAQVLTSKQTLTSKRSAKTARVPITLHDASGHKDSEDSTGKIKTNEEAIEILDKILAMVVTYGVDEMLLRDLRFDFTLEPLVGGTKRRWARANFNLFLFLILVNRAELAHLFFLREAQRDAASTLANALWACLLCRRLSQLPEVGQFAYHLKNGFETTAAKYEGIAKSILTLAHKKSDRFTHEALERPLKQCPKWTLLDLIAQGDCRDIISECPEACIAAVQSRFYGEGSLVAVLERMNGNVHDVLAKCWDPLIAMIGVKDNPSQASGSKIMAAENGKPQSWAGRLMEALVRKVADVIKKPETATSMQTSKSTGKVVGSSQTESLKTNDQENLDTQSWGKLLICIAVDAVGASYYVYPLLPWFFYAYIWAPVMALVIHSLHRNTCLSIFACIEELLPILDLFPSATIGYLLHNQRIMETKAMLEAAHLEGDCNGNEIFKQAITKGFVPIDHFILDILTYCVLAHLLTVVVLMTPSFSTFCLELVVMALIFIDAIPDIVFEGMQDTQSPDSESGEADGSSTSSPLKRSISSMSETQNDYDSKKLMKLSLASLMTKGFRKYVQKSGERLELLCCMSFVTGFVMRYTGMLLWSLSLAGGTQGADRACSVLYGIAVSTMWFRILEFVLVQQDLGKVLE